MNTKKYSSAFKSIQFFTLLLLQVSVYGQELNTSINKTIPLDAKNIVYISSPGLDVDVNTWDKNELKVDYQLSIKAKTEEELKEFYSAFEKILTKQLSEAKQGNVYANVRFSSFSQNNNKIKVKFEGDNKEYNLEKFGGSIIVYMPKSNALNAKTSFHKLDIGDLNADASIEINSGAFAMGNCKKLDLKANFTKNMKIGKVENAKMTMNSSDVTMGAIMDDLFLSAQFSNMVTGNIGNRAEIKLNSTSFETSDIKTLDLKGSFIRLFKANNIGEARMDVNSSKIEARKINSLKIDKVSFSDLSMEVVGDVTVNTSSSSKFNFQNVNSFNAANSSFSNFTISSLGKLFTLNAQSGEVQIGNVAKGFDKIDITGTFLTMNVGVSPGSDYLINADLKFPNYNISGINMKNHIKEMSHEVINGWKGANENASSKIILNCQSCRITIK